MRDLYSACFDFGRMSLGAVSGANAAVFSGGLTGNVGFASGMYAHGSVACTTGGGYIDGVFLEPFKNDVQAIVAGLAIAFDPATVTYTLSAAGAFVVTWSGLQGAAMRDILGFSGAATASAASHTSTQRPKYAIVSAVAGQSQVHEVYEPSGRIAYVESDNGSAYSIRPDALPQYRDWVQGYESTGPTDAAWTAAHGVAGAPVRATDVGSATLVTWSWQDFYRHVSAELPFILADRATSVGGEGTIYKLRGDGAHFDPTRVTADFDGHWSMPLRCRYIDVGAAA